MIFVYHVTVNKSTIQYNTSKTSDDTSKPSLFSNVQPFQGMHLYASSNLTDIVVVIFIERVFSLCFSCRTVYNMRSQECPIATSRKIRQKARFLTSEPHTF